MNQANKPHISIVTPLYKSAETIEDFYTRARAAVKLITDRYEIIFVNDASPDDSLNTVLRVQVQDPQVIVIDLARNFGQHKANITGLARARGDYVFLIESDLEEPPELLGEFYRELTKDPNVDVVFGQQKRRKGATFERFSGWLFYKIFNWLSTTKIPENHITLRLMTHRYVESLIKHREQDLFIAGLYELAGFTQKPLVVTKLSRSATTYSFRQKIKIVVNAVTSFSVVPLWLIFLGGFFAFLSSAGVIAYGAIQWLSGAALSGQMAVIASIWAVGGLIMMSLGVVGFYIKKVIEEVKERPYTIVKKIYESNSWGQSHVAAIAFQKNDES